jgi:hypothetical protein
MMKVVISASIGGSGHRAECQLHHATAVKIDEKKQPAHGAPAADRLQN